MLHWTPTLPLGFAGLSPAPALPADPASMPASRADHARMLAHAAARRLRAAGDDRAYWLKGAPAALAKAAALRTAGFARLP